MKQFQYSLIGLFLIIAIVTQVRHIVSIVESNLIDHKATIEKMKKELVTEMNTYNDEIG